MGQIQKRKLMKRVYRHTVCLAALLLSLLSCGAGKKTPSDSTASISAEAETPALAFCGDSALADVARQLEFGPRVPGTEAHARCGEWLADRLRALGMEVTEQKATLTTFDGTKIPMRNIFASVNPEAEDRTLLLAHWDSRPWADNDPDPTKHKEPVPAANDGASGVAVLLELARVLATSGTSRGIDILLCDAEDWGTEGDDDSWALGTRYFAEHPIKEGYTPSQAILVDMVGARDAVFPREYFSQRSAPSLVDRIWATADALGYGELFPNRIGSAVNDDHVELLKAGIPAIDIIDYREGSGFFPYWHTAGDTLDKISPETLEAVGRILEQFLNEE